MLSYVGQELTLTCADAAIVFDHVSLAAWYLARKLFVTFKITLSSAAVTLLPVAVCEKTSTEPESKHATKCIAPAVTVFIV